MSSMGMVLIALKFFKKSAHEFRSITIPQKLVQGVTRMSCQPVMAQLVEDGGALAMPYQVQSSFWTFAAPWIPKSWHALVLALNKTPRG